MNETRWWARGKQEIEAHSERKRDKDRLREREKADQKTDQGGPWLSLLREVLLRVIIACVGIIVFARVCSSLALVFAAVSSLL